MDKKFYIVGAKHDFKVYEDKDSAVNVAKKFVADPRRGVGIDMHIFEAVAKVAAPVPEAEVTELA